MGLAVAGLAVLAGACASVVEAGPDATPGKGFQEIVVTTAPTTTTVAGSDGATSSSPDGASTSAPATTSGSATSSAPTAAPTTAPTTSAVPAAGPTTSDATTGTSPSGGLVFTVGDCLDWDQSTTTVTFLIVDCDADHLVEIAGEGDLSQAFGPTAAFPDLDALTAAVSDVCTPLVDSYLGGPPADDVAPGVIPPSEASWKAGDRTAWCTVGLARVDSKRPSYTGHIADR